MHVAVGRDYPKIEEERLQIAAVQVELTAAMAADSKVVPAAYAREVDFERVSLVPAVISSSRRHLLEAAVHSLWVGGVADVALAALFVGRHIRSITQLRSWVGSVAYSYVADWEEAVLAWIAVIPKANQSACIFSRGSAHWKGKPPTHSC